MFTITRDLRTGGWVLTLTTQLAIIEYGIFLDLYSCITAGLFFIGHPEYA